MRGEYPYYLTEDVNVLFFYSYEVDRSGDHWTPNGGTTLDIDKVELTDGKVTIDITSCVDELCGISISDIEDQIQEQIEQ